MTRKRAELLGKAMAFALTIGRKNGSAWDAAAPRQRQYYIKLAQAYESAKRYALEGTGDESDAESLLMYVDNNEPLHLAKIARFRSPVASRRGVSERDAFDRRHAASHWIALEST